MAREGPHSRRKLEEDIVLLVEGQDEVNLFRALFERHLEDEGQPVQVLGVGGKDRFRKQFAAIMSDAQARPTFRAVGIVRDADDNARSAFQSVRNSIRALGYQPPARHGEFSDATPSIGVFIVPDGAGTGSMETLCRRSVRGTETANCVDEYLDCLTTRNALQSTNPDKSFSHAYLAAAREPTARVGEGALMGVWDFQSPAFDELNGFIRTLKGI